MAFRFRLVTADGSDFGERELVTEVWAPGDLLPISAGHYLRVVAVDYNPEGSEFSGTLTVEPVE